MQQQPEWAKKRAGRLRRSCVPEVLSAIEQGYLSPSWADKLYRNLPADEQRARITALVARKDRERSSRQLVVEILHRHAASGMADLHLLRRDITAAPSVRRRNRARKQKMFTREQDALIFMDQCRCALRRDRGALLISDAESYWDAVRAREVLRGHPGTSLELAAHLLVLCKSTKERRGGSFEAPAERTVKLESRVWLGLEDWCKREGWNVGNLVAKLLWKFLEEEAEKMRKEERRLERDFRWWDEDGGGNLIAGASGGAVRTRTRSGKKK